MPSKEILRQAEVKMKKAIEALTNEFHTVRTGRANPALLDSIRVDYYGNLTPIKQMATVGTPEARLIDIHPWDPTQLGAIERAIQQSDLGLSPQNDGKHIRLVLPQPTAERRLELEKVAKRMSEEARVSLRNTRREARDAIKVEEDGGKLSEDQSHTAQDDLQKVTDRFAKEVDHLFTEKDKEIQTV